MALSLLSNASTITTGTGVLLVDSPSEVFTFTVTSTGSFKVSLVFQQSVNNTTWTTLTVLNLSGNFNYSDSYSYNVPTNYYTRALVTQISGTGTTVNVQVTQLSNYQAPLLVQYDTSGNAIANIIPRTDTMTNLSTLLTGGIGELAYASDTQSIVTLRGSTTPPIKYCPMSPGTWTDSTGAFTALGGLPLTLTTAIPTVAGVTPAQITIQPGTTKAGDTTANAAGISINVTTPPTPANSAPITISTDSNNAIVVYPGSIFSGAANTSALGFFNVATVATLQPTPTLAGTAGTIPTNTGVALNTLATFNGIGSGNAYTINQIVAALKLLGLLA